MKKNVILSLVLISGGFTLSARSIDLEHETVVAWRDYVERADAGMQARADARGPFLWIDSAGERRNRVRQGEVVVEPVGDGTQIVAKGLVHDWIGAVFIPQTTVENLLAVLHNYDRYREIYKPAVADSRSLASADDGQEFTMTWHRKVLFVNAAIQGWYRAREVALDPHRGYNVVETTRIQQIEDYRRRSERLLAPDTGSGFMWRVHSITRYEQRDGGVYLEIEAIALTRDIPASFRWLVSPIVRQLAINSLTTTLRQTREAVQMERGRQEQAAGRVSPRDGEGIRPLVLESGSAVDTARADVPRLAAAGVLLHPKR